MKKNSAKQTASSHFLPAVFVPPMKALGSETLPKGIWHCEVKFDGYRAIGVLNAGRAELWSRNRKAMTADYPDVAAELATIPCQNAVLDGEIVALDEKGRSRFQLLQNRGTKEVRVVYNVFDLLHLDGKSLLAETLEVRTGILKRLLKKTRFHVRPSPVFKVAPSALFQAARQNGLEGIVAKRVGSLYEPDRRTGAWLKCKAIAEQEFVIGGFTAPQKSRRYFGAILVGYFKGGKLHYAGKVGTGFDGPLLESLHAMFVKKRAQRCPFGDLPSYRRSRFGKGMGPAEMREVTWVLPKFVAQIKFAEWTDEGLLRQPVFLGLRRDKVASEVRREPGKTAIRKRV